LNRLGRQHPRARGEANGAAAHVILPPLSLCGPVLTIRKFSFLPYAPHDLVTLGTISPRAIEFLAACVRGRANIMISGGASSGKTTLLNVLASFIPDRERLITIEDAAELRLGKSHVVGLEARPPNVRNGPGAQSGGDGAGKAEEQEAEGHPGHKGDLESVRTKYE
jgi:pilus assembly protein CpaF